MQENEFSELIEASDEEVDVILGENPNVDYYGNELTRRSFKDSAIVTFLVTCCLILLKLIIGHSFDSGMTIVFFMLAGLFDLLDGKRSEKKKSMVIGTIMTGLAVVIMIGYIASII